MCVTARARTCTAPRPGGRTGRPPFRPGARRARPWPAAPTGAPARRVMEGGTGGPGGISPVPPGQPGPA
eukprot:808107-Prymnesium_polylepis.2